jgi:cytochrome c-type biogenesis protein CcmH/NrfF
VTLRSSVRVLGVVVAFLLAAPALAESPVPGSVVVGGAPDWAYSMAHNLMSPFCPGRTLAACPSPQADQLRQWILMQAASGVEREQLEEMLFEQFGDDVMRSSPRAEGGWGISAYAIPVGGFLLGGGIVALVIRRLAGAGAALPDAAAAAAAPRSARPRAPLPSDAELARRVDEELLRS